MELDSDDEIMEFVSDDDEEADEFLDQELTRKMEDVSISGRKRKTGQGRRNRRLGSGGGLVGSADWIGEPGPRVLSDLFVPLLLCPQSDEDEDDDEDEDEEDDEEEDDEPPTKAQAMAGKKQQQQRAAAAKKAQEEDDEEEEASPPLLKDALRGATDRFPGGASCWGSRSIELRI